MSSTEPLAPPETAPAAAPAPAAPEGRPARRVLRAAPKEDEVATVRKFGLIALVGFGVLGALAAWRHHPLTAKTMVTIGVLLYASCSIAPARMAPFYRGWMRVAHVMGIVNTWVILTIFYGFLTLFGLVMRLIGRDALGLRIDRGAATYWVPKARPDGVKSYFRQF